MPPVVDRERPFALHELFFSITDAKGHVTAANDVFCRVSAIERDDLLGKAHNIVRHPDMPRAVFSVFWETLTDGRGIAAYVKNLAADGAYYWVMALAVPVDGGFLSVRLKPSSPMFAVAQDIYREVRACEQRVEGGDVRRRKEAIAAGVERLGELLAAAGFADYRAFMHAALVAEVAARREALGSASDGAGDDGMLGACEAHLDRLVAELAGHRELARELESKSAFVLGLAEEIRLFALNAVLTSSRLGARGAALAAVAEILGRRSDEAEPAIRALNDDLGAALALLNAMSFRIAAGKLMTEMVTVLVDDLGTAGGSAGDMNVEIAALACALRDSGERLALAITDFAARVRAVEASVSEVDSQLRVVRALEVNGRVEGARLDDATIAQLFATIARQVADAREQLKTFAALGEAGGARHAESEAETVRAVVVGAGERVAALAAA